jgi:transposase
MLAPAPVPHLHLLLGISSRTGDRSRTASSAAPAGWRPWFRVPGKHAVVLMEQAGWHISKKLVSPPNITILPLPPKSHELNPAENVWQFMRDNWISNLIFTCYDNIVAHCCDAWNKPEAQLWRVMSLGLRDLAHGY